MVERPILFSAPMVLAILEGRKTQTRRVMKRQLGDSKLDGAVGRSCFTPDGMLSVRGRSEDGETGEWFLKPSYGVPGDRLWLKETHHRCPHCERGSVVFKAGGWMRLASGAPDDGGDRDDRDARPLPPKCAAHGWRPSIFLPRRFSRITLEITDVRVQRLHDIGEEDARAEGAERGCPPSCGPIVGCDPGARHGHRDGFSALWRDINGAASWDANPWVWVISFKRIEAPPPSPGEEPR